MMHSIFIDFCELSTNEGGKVDLIQEIILQYFLKDMEDLSKDKVINVRIKLAEVFADLY